tara:strand:+ start:1413 stop:1658 length:246 start_codon:yes stop_codon:yes gene_type:complete
LQKKLISVETIANMTLQEWKTLKNIKTLGELANKIGVNKSKNPARLVQRWLDGTSYPRKRHLDMIFKATNGKVTANDFFTN